mmetsp:Transcript_86164/g.258241  ORF Transcript_86164/g.258241 Transcript_86164/m.258241 type:complete len:298 (+) Transcript_86164:409-1302(+)
MEQDEHETYFLDLGLEKWLPHVEDLSFETISIPLLQDEAKLIRACYKHLHSGTVPASTLPPNLCTPLAALGHRLAPALESLAKRNASAAVFAKLSGRSSKDAPLHTAQLDADFAANLAAAHAAPADDNARLICLFDAALSVMKVSDVAHLLWLLVNSQRVDEDLDVALRHPERYDQCVVLREWWDGVSTDLEFRMFCVGGKPTGLTQYNHIVYSERLSARRRDRGSTCPILRDAREKPPRGHALLPRGQRPVHLRLCTHTRGAAASRRSRCRERREQHQQRQRGGGGVARPRAREAD